MGNSLLKATEIGLTYSLFSNDTNLKEFGQDMAILQELENTIVSLSPQTPQTPQPQEVLSLVKKSIENGLNLNQLFDSTKKSLPEILEERRLDKDYLNCVKSKDNGKLENILKFAVEKYDHKLTVYRGDDKPYNDYTESLRRCWEDKSCGGALGRGLYFASTERYADIFGAKARYKGITRKFFIKADPVDLDAPGVGDFITEFQAPYMDEVKRLDELAKPHRKGRKPNDPKHPDLEAYDIYVDKLQNQVFKAIKEKFRGDSVCVKEYGLFARDGEYEYNIQKPKHVKLADLVVYDDDGKIIPLSKRFDTKSSDIRGMTKKALLKLPLKDGLKYLAKDCYADGISLSKWKEKLITTAINLIKTAQTPTKKIQEELPVEIL